MSTFFMLLRLLVPVELGFVLLPVQPIFSIILNIKRNYYIFIICHKQLKSLYRFKVYIFLGSMKGININWKNLSSKVFKGFFKQLTKYQQKKYYSLPNTIQSSVGLIFRLSKQQSVSDRESFNKIIDAETVVNNAELLFVQRAGYHLDRNAFNIVFPGGQCDNQESDLEACVRQLNQEIGINALKQCIHVGQIPSNFYYLKKRGKEVHISCHIFVMKTSDYEWTPTLNSDQLRQFKWVSMNDLLRSQNYKERNQIKLGVFDRMPKFAASIAKNQITNVTLPQLDLGMDRNLWGLTLWIWSYVMQMSFVNIQKEKVIQKQQIQVLKRYIKMMKGLQLKFKPYSILKYPASLLASGWHYMYRVRPFRYNEYEPFVMNKKMVLSAITILILLLVLLTSDFSISSQSTI